MNSPLILNNLSKEVALMADVDKEISKDAVDTTVGQWQMGLKGIFSLIANCTAIGLICLMFYQDRHVTLQHGREDRQMFREELREQRQYVGRLSMAIENLSMEVRKLREKQP
jgi:uncharacterized membrane protein